MAAVTAGIVAAVEQYNRLGARPTLRNQAWVWWGARIFLEMAIGVAAVALLQSTGIPGSNELWGWLTAGASGPAIVRLRVLDIGKGAGERPLGPATVYEPLRGLIEDQIDRRSAEEQALWISRELLPALERKQPDPADLADLVIDYIRGRRGLETDEREREIHYIEEIRDGSQPPHVKREAIARHAAATLGAFRLLNRFKEARPKQLPE